MTRYEEWEARIREQAAPYQRRQEGARALLAAHRGSAGAGRRLVPVRGGRGR